MKCPKCEKEIDGVCNACPYCGENIQEEKQSAENQPQVEESQKNEAEEDEGIKKASSVNAAATFIMVLGIIGSVIGGIIAMVTTGDTGVLVGLGIMFGGILLSVIIYTFISGFAMLIKKTSLIELNTRKKE